MHQRIVFVTVFLFILSNLPEFGYSQNIPINDPVENYLRLLETREKDVSLSSFNFRPVTIEEYIPGYDFSRVHPWQSHQFFENWKGERDSINVISAIENEIVHNVKQGETLYSISRIYNVSVDDLTQLNNVQDNIISVDQRLIVQQKVVEFEVKTPVEVSHTPASPVQFYSPVITTTYNNNYPIGHNDSVMWQGRGINTSFSLGTNLSYGRIRASIRPNITYSENRDFELSDWPQADGISEFGYGFSMIDYPQRFGEESLRRIDPGQSWIRVEHNEFSTGISTANIWAGPAINNAILLSNNAPGFFHAFVGTHKPFDTGYGKIEGRVFWGGLRESDYFDEDESNNLRLINGIIFNYNPSFITGLHIGFSRVFIKNYGEGISFSDYFMFAKPFSKQNSEGFTDRLQMQSLFARWQIPDYGFEIYGEWARNNPAVSIRDFLMQPEHSRGYTIGFMNRFTLLPKHWLVLNFELTQLERPRSVEFRDSEPYYLSSSVKQGYTHRGQILGAAIGPGSNSQKVGLNYYNPFGMLGVSFNRIVHDNDRLYENYEIIGLRPWGIRNPRMTNEVEFRFGLNTIIFVGSKFELQADVIRSKFFHFRYAGFTFGEVYNTNLQFTLRYNIPGFLR